MTDIEIAVERLGKLLHAGNTCAIFDGGHLEIDDRLGHDDLEFSPFGHGAETEAEKARLFDTVWCGERAYWRIVGAVPRVPTGIPATGVPATGASVLIVPVPVAPSVSGPDMVKAGFSNEECERIDAARGDAGRSNWARAIVLDAVRSGRAVPAVRGAGSKPSYVNFRMSGPDAAALDKARGLAARAAFVRAAILAACG